MATNTANYDLVKPAETDFYDIAVQNGNMDTIDAALAEQGAALAGKADLGADGKVVAEQLPVMNYVPTSDKGVAGGVADLDDTGKVPVEQLPAMDYIPTSEKGVAGGVAELGADGKVVGAQLPAMDFEPLVKSAGEKASVADADSLVLVDSADGQKTKRLSWANLKAALKTINDLLYAKKVHKHGAGDLTSGVVADSQLPERLLQDKLLSSATAALYGNGVADVDGALRNLGRFNSSMGDNYLWKKEVVTHTLAEEPYGIMITILRTASLGSETPINIKYSDSIEVFEGAVSLVNPKTFSSTYADFNNTSASVLGGKYVSNYPDKDSIVKVASPVVTEKDSYRGELSFLAKAVTRYKASEKRVEYGYVNSAEENGYPPSIDDRYTYIPMGLFGGSMRIGMGSYVGTGTFGLQNPTIIKMEPWAKFLWVQRIFSNGAIGIGVTSTNYGLIPLRSLNSEWGELSIVDTQQNYQPDAKYMDGVFKIYGVAGAYQFNNLPDGTVPYANYQYYYFG